MDDSVAYIYKDYRIEFGGDETTVSGEAYYKSEKGPVGRVNGHFYNSKDKNDKSHKKDNTLHIDLLIVTDQHNNKGVGTTLMKMLMLYAEKRKVKHVTTSPSPIGKMSTKQLEKFYRKFHFSTGIMVKRIEFVDDDDFLDEFEEENSSNSSSSENVPQEHRVARTTESIDPFKQLDDAILQDDIEAAFKLLDEEVVKINARKEILKELSEKTMPSNVRGNESQDKPSIDCNTEVKETDNYSNIGILTTMYYIEENLPKNSEILEITNIILNENKDYFTNKGHHITGVEYLDLSKLEENSFDVVLCIGLMDELETFEEQQEQLKEAYRICKEKGRVFVSFTSNDMEIVDQVLNNNYDFLKSENVNKKTLKILKSHKKPMVLEEMDELIKSCDMQYLKRFAMDGIAGLMKSKINEMTEVQFNKWMKYHLYSCEKQEALNYSTSIIYIIKKK